MKTQASLVIGLFLGTAGCVGSLDDFSDAGPADSGPTDPNGPRPLLVPADVLFVVDNSASMAPTQARLAAAFDAFAGQVAGQGDFRIGVVSTDLDSSGGEWGGLVVQTHASSSPFALQSVDSNGCFDLGVPHGCFRGPTGAAAVLDASALTRGALVTGFSNAIQIGTCGSGSEKGLGSMVNALEKSGCAADRFIRPEANLIVVLVSDEDDTNNTPISRVLSQLAALKPLEQTRIAVVGGLVDGQPTSCAPGYGAGCGSICSSPPPPGSQTACSGSGTQCPAGEYCDNQFGQCENEALRYWSSENCAWCAYFAAPDCCAARGANRYAAFAHAFEAGASLADPSIPVVGCDGSGPRPVCLLESICQDDLSATLARIARVLMLGVN